MSAAVLNLQAREHRSSVLDRWAASRPGAQERIGGTGGVQASGENSVTTNLTAEQLMATLGLVNGSAAGVVVTAETAMRVSTVYACVSLLAGAISTLPFAIFERDGDLRQRATHDYWWMLNEQANEHMTSAAAWEYLLSSKLFYGDGFARLLRPSFASNRVIGWEPLHPLRVQPFFAADDGALYYRYQPRRGPAIVLDSADIIHLPSLGFDGLTSPSPITYAAREVIGTALAAETYSGKFFNGGATFDYALKTAATLKTEQLNDLKTSLLARVNGSRGPLILTGGLEPAQLSVNPKDAEILATRLFGVQEICSILGVPPYMVGHTDKTSSWGSGVEQQGIGFVRYTLQRHLTPIAQEFNRKLWPTRQRFFVEHVTAALERGDLKSRYEAYRVALGRAGEPAWMRPNEVRRLENLPPDTELDAVPEPPPVPAMKQETDMAMLGMLGAVTAMASREPVTPSVNMPAINIEGAQIKVEGTTVNVPETTVTLEAAITNAMPEQQAAVVNVAAPIVEVQNVMPAFDTDQRIERDAIGDIARIVTTRSKT